ncbi:MAG: cupin domain-containing protein [Micropepsaceae bacterium]
MRYRHLTAAAIGDDYHVGFSVEELQPGKQTVPAHYHMLEEEHIYVLDGQVTLRLGEKTYEMRPGDYACFPAGQQAGHCLINDSAGLVRYIVVGEKNKNDVVIYPDSNKVLVRSLGRREIYDRSATRGYWDGEKTT